MTVEEVVNDFIRDGQYKVAELTIEMDQLDDSGNYLYVEKEKLRHELLTWIDTLFWGRHELVESSQGSVNTDPYNYTASGNAWTDDEIIRECHKLRAKASLNPVPYISWNNYNPQIVSFAASGGSGGNVNFPPGTLGQYLAYDINGNVVAQSWPIYAGALESEDIFDYFLNRQ